MRHLIAHKQHREIGELRTVCALYLTRVEFVRGRGETCPACSRIRTHAQMRSPRRIGPYVYRPTSLPSITMEILPLTPERAEALKRHVKDAVMPELRRLGLLKR